MIGMIFFLILGSFLTIHTASQFLLAWFIIATIIFSRIPIAYLASTISKTRKFAIDLAKKHTEFGLAEKAISNFTGISVGLYAVIQKTWLFIIWSSLRIGGAYLVTNQTASSSKLGFTMIFTSIVLGMYYLRSDERYVQYGLSPHNIMRNWEFEDSLIPAMEAEADYLVKTENDDGAKYHDHGTP